jgi:hypothetical protein
MPQAPATPLLLVGSIEIVPADNAALRARYGVEVRIVVRRALGAPRDLVVHDPTSAPIVMPIDVGFGFRSVVLTREVNANLAVR